MNLPDWIKNVSIYLWLAAAGLLMFAVSLSSDAKDYLDLWLITFLYGLLGFAFDKLGSNNKFRVPILIILLIVYTIIATQFFSGDSPKL